MSKNSPKQSTEQLKDWLLWRTSTTTSKSKSTPRKFSKADHYNKVR